MALWNRGSPVSEMPAFTESVKDRVGAGDALFAAVSLLLATGAPGPVVGLLGNLAGAAMVSDLGNRHSLSAIDLQRHAEALLK
jgi:sugar/nucleoside kinase (ribokinase family)